MHEHTCVHVWVYVCRYVYMCTSVCLLVYVEVRDRLHCVGSFLLSLQSILVRVIVAVMKCHDQKQLREECLFISQFKAKDLKVVSYIISTVSHEKVMTVVFSLVFLFLNPVQQPMDAHS